MRRCVVKRRNVDPRSVGLGDFVRPEGLLARQASRWRRQFDGYEYGSGADTQRVSDDVDLVDHVGAWLTDDEPPERSPAPCTATIFSQTSSERVHLAFRALIAQAVEHIDRI